MYLVMVQIQFASIKKKRIGRPEHSLTPQPPTSDNISFLSYPHPSSLKVDVIYVSHPKCQAESQPTLSTSEKVRSPNVVSLFKTVL